MILEFGAWKLEVDIATTMAYSAAEAAAHCTCLCCQNFYRVIDETYPNLRPFLAQFGLDVEAPDDMMPLMDDFYNAAYAVRGRVLEKGYGPILVDGLRIRPIKPEEALFYTDCPEPHFALSIAPFVLPWVLDVPKEEVIVPPEDPTELLRRMLARPEDVPPHNASAN